MYLRSCLTQGDTISQYLLNLPLEQGEIFTFLPDTVNFSTVKNFEVGGITQKQTTYLALTNLICSYFKSNENSLAIFEAIEQPGDACLATFSEQFITYHHEVYYLITNQDYTLEQIRYLLQRARAYPFIGILTCSSILNNSQLESNELKELVTNVDYILVGAYDDEGVLIWHKNNHYPKLLQETNTESKSLDLTPSRQHLI